MSRSRLWAGADILKKIQDPRSKIQRSTKLQERAGQKHKERRAAVSAAPTNMESSTSQRHQCADTAVRRSAPAETPNSPCRRSCSLDLGAWSFPGVWSLAPGA